MPLQQIDQLDTIPGLHQRKYLLKYKIERNYGIGRSSPTSNYFNPRSCVAIHTGEEKDSPGNQ
jgi:hypothetical protein